MRTRDTGRAFVAKQIAETANVEKVVKELEDNFLVVVDTEPNVDSFFLITTSQGVKYAIRYPKSSWRLQRKEQEDGPSDVETDVKGKSGSADQSDIRERAQQSEDVEEPSTQA